MAVVLGQFFVRAIAELSELYVAMRRLRKFLEYDEKKQFNLEEIKEGLNEKTKEVSGYEKRFFHSNKLPLFNRNLKKSPSKIPPCR